MEARERVLRLIDYAENLQNSKDGLAKQKTNLFVVAIFICCVFIGFLFWTATRSADNDGTSATDITLAIAGVTLFVASALFFWFQYKRLILLELRESDAIGKSTGLLREYLPREMTSPEWGPLDRAEVELRLSRLPIGSSHDWESFNESIPIYFNFQDIQWQKLFENTTNLTIFVAYARTWRNRNMEYLQKLVNKTNSQLTVLLPSRKSKATISELSRRFAFPSDELVGRIGETISDYAKMSDGNIEIREVDAVPTVTYYLFDDYAVIAFYSHAQDRRPVPATVISKSSQLYDFVKNELDVLMQMSEKPDEC